MYKYCIIIIIIIINPYLKITYFAHSATNVNFMKSIETLISRFFFKNLKKSSRILNASMFSLATLDWCLFFPEMSCVLKN